MKRTQIYLTEEEHESIKMIAERRGRPQSEVIRAAVDHYVEQHRGGNRLDYLKSARGMWAERNDLPDFERLRRELDRA